MACSQGGQCGSKACTTKKVVDTISHVVCYFFPGNKATCATAISATIGSTIIYLTNTKAAEQASEKPTLEHYKPIKLNDLDANEANHYNGLIQNISTDSTRSNIIFGHKEGSHIWPKSLSKIMLDEGPDNLYFSLCSTKIYNGKVTTIEYFDAEQDKLWFFCTMNTPRKEEFKINKASNPGYTCIEIRDTAICLNDDYDISAENIGITNKTFVASIFDSAIV